MAKIITRTRTPAGGPGTPKTSDFYRTNPAVFTALHAEFAFDVDCAANAVDHLCPRWIGPGGIVEDALKSPVGSSGGAGRRGFLNPPYSTWLIRRFMARVVVEIGAGMDLLVCLVPHDPSVQWWQSTRTAVEIREIPHRVPYLKADGTPVSGAMYPSCVVILRPQPGILRAQPRRVVWSWRRREELRGW